MSTIYLQNCTAQVRTFCYRMDYRAPGDVIMRSDRVGFRQVTLKPWGSAPIEVEKPMVGDVVKQFERHNVCSEGDVPNRLRGVVPAIYREDQAVSLRARQAVVEHNRSAKNREGLERRQRAAIAANDAVTRNLEQAGHGEAVPSGFEVELEQLNDSEVEGTTRLEEGIRVEAAPPARRGGRRASA